MKKSNWTAIHFLEKTSYCEIRKNGQKKKNQSSVGAYVLWTVFTAMILEIFAVSMFAMIFEGMSFSYNSAFIYAVSFVAILIMTALSVSKIPFGVGVAVYGLLLARYGWMETEVLKNGFLSIYNRGSEMVTTYFSGHVSDGLWSGSLQTEVYLWIALALVLYIILFAVGIKKVFLASIPGIAGIIGILLVGHIPPLLWLCIFAVAFCILYVCMYGRGRFGKYSMMDAFGKYLYIRGFKGPVFRIGIKAGLCTLGMLAICIGLSVAAKNILRLPDEEALKAYKEQVQGWYDENVPGLNAMAEKNQNHTSKGGISQGDLASAGDLYYRGDEQLKIFVESQPNSTLYIKGYVGDTYENNRWKSGTGGGFEEIPGNAVETVLNLPYYLMYSDGTGRIDIQKLVSFGKIDFIAYGAKSENQPWVDDLYIGGDNDTVSYMYCPEFYDFMGNMDTLSALGMNDGSSLGLSADLEDIRNIYKDYVYSRYTQVPDSIRTVLSEFNSGVNLSGLKEKLVYVRQRLNESCSYTLTPGAVPDGKDFTQYFLTENHRGYCMHFATAATLLLREMGVPARYVEGYIAIPGSFHGTDSGLAATVYDHQAHAWTEIFVDGFGWVPVEMTPSYYDENMLNTYPQDGEESQAKDNETVPPEDESLSQDSETVQSDGETVMNDSSDHQTANETLSDGQKADSGKNLSGLGEDEKDAGQKPFQDDKAKSGKALAVLKTVFVWILKIFGAVLAVLAVIAGRYMGIKALRERRKYRQPRKKALIGLYHETIHLLSCAGFPVDAGADINAYIELLANQLDFIDKNEMRSLVAMVNRAAFGPGDIPLEQWKEAKLICRKIRENVLKRQSRLKYLYLVYIRCC